MDNPTKKQSVFITGFLFYNGKTTTMAIIMCTIVCPFPRSVRRNEFIVGRTQLDTGSLTRQTEPLCFVRRGGG